MTSQVRRVYLGRFGTLPVVGGVRLGLTEEEVMLVRHSDYVIRVSGAESDGVDVVKHRYGRQEFVRWYSPEEAAAVLLAWLRTGRAT